MKTRTLAVLVLVVVLLAVGALAVKGQSEGSSVVDWFKSLHGGGH